MECKLLETSKCSSKLRKDKQISEKASIGMVLFHLIPKYYAGVENVFNNSI